MWILETEAEILHSWQSKNKLNEILCHPTL